MRKCLTGFTLILIMLFNVVYLYDLGSSLTEPLNNVSINNLRGNEFQDSDDTIQSSDAFVQSKTSDIPSGWNYQKLVTLNPVTSKADYQVKVILTEENFDYTHALSDGADIRFQDIADSPLSYWIESWNENGKSIIWVKIPTVGTDSFYMNYGNPNTISASNGDATFLFFDDFSGASINPSKWTTINGLSSSTTVSDGIVSLAIDHPINLGSGLIAGFTDFQINQGASGSGYATFENTVSLGQIWGGSHYVETRDTGTNSLSPDVILPKQWLTSDIRWLSDSNVQFNNNSYLTTHKDSATIPSGPLQVRIIAASGYSGPGTWYSAALHSISAWGQAGRALRMNSYHDFIPYDGATPVEIQVDWIVVRNCADQEPAVTVVSNDLTITSPETRNYPGPSKGHYPASYGFENDPSFPYSDITAQGLPMLTGQPPEGWIPHYSGQTGALRVIDEYMGHKKVVELRRWTGSFGKSYVGLTKYFPTTATAGTIEFWLNKPTDTGLDATKFILTGTAGTIEFGIENQALYRGVYTSRVNISEYVFPKDTWKRIRVDFDISQGGWQIQLDSTLYGSGYTFPFEGSPTEITGFDIRSHGSEYPSGLGDYPFYLDAVGYSWDSSYMIGDNLNEGLLLGFDPIVQSRTDWNGYYHGSEGFDHIPAGGQPDNWGYWQGGSTSGASTPAPEMYVVDSITDNGGNTHNRVLYGKDDSGGTIFNGDGFWDKPQSSGTVEFWVMNHDPLTNYGVYFGLLAENQTYYGSAVVSQDGNTFRIMNGSNGWEPTGISFVDDKWYRISMDFSGDGTYAGLAANHYRARLYDSDGTSLLYASPEVMYQRNGSSVAFHAGTGDSCRANLYFDAIGYSWDPNYVMGNNALPAVYEGPELIEVSWIGYSLDGQPNVTITGATTIPMPLAGEHSIQLFIEDSYGNWYSSSESFLTEQITLVTPETKNYAKGMNTYFPGTYGFENEPYNSFGLDIDFIDEYYSSHPVSSYVFFATRPSRPVADHFNVLNLVDAQGGGWCWGVHNFDSPPTAGTVEFLLKVTGTAGTHYFELRAANDLPAIEMRATFSGSKLQYFDGSVWQDISDLIVNQWFHHSITFDCEAGVNGQFSWIVTYENGTEFDRVDNIEFQNDLNTLDELYLGTTVADYQIGTWWDAFGFSWEGYTPGDNFNPGLLISFDTPTTFDWTGYSLDGGANVTILGNKTIPLPSTGTHTIQLFGRDLASNAYRSVLRKFTVRTIDIDTPLDMTYNTPMEGYYPATYGFENEKIGEANPYGFVNTDASNCQSSVIEELDGHKNIIQQFDNSNGFGAVLTHNFDSPQLFGTVEFYQQTTSFRTDGRPSIAAYLKSVTGSEIVFAMGQYVESTHNFAYDNGSGWPNIRGDANVNQWYHISISWRCTGASTYQNLAEGSWKVLIDGIEYGNYELLRDEAFISLLLSTAGVHWNYYSYWDAVGLSWDPGYTIGDNLNEGLLLGCTYDALKEGHYPGSFSFETDTEGTFPEGWEDWSGAHPIDTWVVDEYLGHSKVLRGYDGGTGAVNARHYFEEREGTIELWMAPTSIAVDQSIQATILSKSGSLLTSIKFLGGDIEVYNAGVSTVVDSFSVPAWYHIRLDYRSANSTTAYAGLSQNQFQLYINGINYGVFDFFTIGDPSYIRLYTEYAGSGYEVYFDAIGFSSDSDYEVNDNFYEGPINSYNTKTPLEWLGYSLDGQANVTIHGNHTIPMPTNGIHTIQVVGFDYLGNYYRSDVRSFQTEVIPPDPPTISGSSDFSVNYGDTGYFILWTATDLFPSNYTIYRNQTVFGADDWVTTNIIASCNGLEEGKHNFTCVVQNDWGFKTSDEVWITVLPMTPDVTPPVISSPDDITFEEGSIGYTIIWSGSDDRSPWWASVEKDSSIIYSQAWVGNDIEIDLTGLSIDVYEFNCTLSDEAGNSIFDIVTVTVIAQVPDTDPPAITAPSPLTYEVGTTGNTLTWICFDNHPFAYDVFVNNTATGFVESLGYYAWHGENITYSFDGLAEGNWEAILILYDLSLNNVTSIITITVIPPIPDTTSPTLSTPADIIVSENMAGTIMWEVDDAHPENFIITRNGTQIFAQNYWVSGIIQYHFTSLPLGTWSFNLICWDEAGNSASSIAIVKVLPGSQVDTTGPQISHHPDVDINYGDTGNIVVFYLFDAHPEGYQVSLLSGKIIADNPNWITPNIRLEISLDDLAIGEYSLTITAWDTFDNTNSRVISVSVIGDVTPPSISSPPDITGYANLTIIITWTVSDQTLSHCEVLSLPTGNIVNHSDPFSGNEYVFTTILLEGTYKYRFVVYDLSGNFAFDDVVVTIKPTPGSSPGFELIFIIPVLMLIVLFRSNVVSRRRLKK